MYIGELVLEITRRCNIQCRHCLRGKAQSRYMSFETLRKALIGVNSIGTITFTGGEPTLNVPFIRYFTEYVRNMHINVGSFYVITNGKIASRSLKDALIRLSWVVDDVGSCGLYISQDQFHKELSYNQYSALDLYEDLPFFYPTQRREKIEMPVEEGLAYENGIGVRPASLDPLVIEREEDGSVGVVEGTVYVNVNGDVIPSCNLSYASQEQEKIGNVYEKSIEDIALQYERGLKEPDDLIVNHNDELIQEVA